MIKAYKNCDPDSEEGQRLRKLLQLNIGCEETLNRILGVTAADDREEESGPVKTSTFSTIDTFLEKYGHNNQPDGYMANLEAERKKEEDLHEELRNLIKNRHYEEALEIINRQNLINPKKNIYFADQIRFLKKLIDLKKS